MNITLAITVQDKKSNLKNHYVDSKNFYKYSQNQNKETIHLYKINFFHILGFLLSIGKPNNFLHC